jgi:drug/metabolite transporter (DMT)-like permease
LANACINSYRGRVERLKFLALWDDPGPCPGRGWQLLASVFVLLWSTGFIGARYGLPYIEPLTFLAVRMVFAVVIMAGIALAGGASWPHANEVGHSLVAGSLVHGLCLNPAAQQSPA